MVPDCPGTVLFSLALAPAFCQDCKALASLAGPAYMAIVLAVNFLFVRWFIAFWDYSVVVMRHKPGPVHGHMAFSGGLQEKRGKDIPARSVDERFNPIGIMQFFGNCASFCEVI